MGNIISAAGTQSVDAFISSLLESLPPIYNVKDRDTVHALLYRVLAEELVKVDIALESVANQNYLSVPVVDEFVVRGASDRDRLQNENAFELGSIRFSASSARLLQNVTLQLGENKIQLKSIPNTDIDFVVFSIYGSINTPTNFPTSFDAANNILTITANKAGAYTIAYQDTGNVLTATENLFVPEGLFRLGFDEGPYNELGWGE